MSSDTGLPNSQEAWNHLYSSLISKLREMQLAEVANEVQLAASARIIEEGNDVLPLFSNSHDLDTTISRAPRPREAFYAAFNVLETRLIEVPELINAVEQRLGYLRTHIQWLRDAGPNDIVLQLEEFSGTDFVLSPSEQEQIESTIINFKHLLESLFE